MAGINLSLSRGFDLRGDDADAAVIAGDVNVLRPIWQIGLSNNQLVHSGDSTGTVLVSDRS